MDGRRGCVCTGVERVRGRGRIEIEGVVVVRDRGSANQEGKEDDDDDDHDDDDTDTEGQRGIPSLSLSLSSLLQFLLSLFFCYEQYIPTLIMLHPLFRYLFVAPTTTTTYSTQAKK